MVISKETENLILELAKDIKEHNQQTISDFQLSHIINYRLCTFGDIDLGENSNQIILDILNHNQKKIIIPTKELLSKILGIEVTEVRHNLISNSDVIYYETTDINTKSEFSPTIPYISYNNLAFKCKVWAFNLDKQFIIKSYTVKNAGVCEVKDKMGIHIETVDARTEAEAIIMTCEWILNDRN